jgi:hypothetical protein
VRTPTRLALVLSIAVVGAARAADVPLPGGVADVEGPRTLALSAGIGAAAGNEGIYLNPGAIAARKHYSIEGGALFDRRGGETVDRFLGGSIVDSESSPLTAGVSYQRVQEKGAYTGGNLIHLALAGPLAQGFFLGVSGKYLSLSGNTLQIGGGPTSVQVKDVQAVTADAGVLWQVAELVSIGITGYNLVPISNPGVAPLGMGAGVAVGSDRSFQVLVDWRADFDHRNDKGSNRIAVGAEALIFDLVPVRAGWMKDQILGTSWWSAGLGLVTRNGVAFDVGYRQSIDDPNARAIAASLKFFVNVPQ